jgi:hypothetical protein
MHDNNFRMMFGHHPAIPVAFDSDGKPLDRFGSFFPNNVFRYPMTGAEMRHVLSEANVGAPGEQSVVPYGLSNDQYGFASLALDGKSGVGVRAKGYKLVKFEEDPDSDALTGRKILATFESPYGPPFTTRIDGEKLANGVGSSDLPKLLDVYQKWWDTIGGEELAINGSYYDKDIGKSWFPANFSLSFGIEEATAEIEPRARVLNRVDGSPPWVSVVPTPDGGHYVTVRDRAGGTFTFEVDKDRNIWTVKIDHYRMVTRTTKRPAIKNADDQMVQAVAYGKMTGLSPTSVKRMVADGVVIGRDGIEYNGKSFPSVAAYEDERKRVVAAQLLEEELGSLGDLSAGSFTATGFADLAGKALRVGEDNPKSKLKNIQIQGGGAWASQGSDLKVQEAWLAGFPVADTVVAAASVETVGLPDDSEELVPVPSWLPVVDVGAPDLMVSRDEVTVGDDGVTRLPAGLVAQKAWNHMMSVLEYKRNASPDDDLLSMLESVGEVQLQDRRIAKLRRSIAVLEEQIASGNPPLGMANSKYALEDNNDKLGMLLRERNDEIGRLGIPEDTDYRMIGTAALEAYRDKVGADEFRDQLVTILLDAQNGAWADSSQSHFSTMQAFVVTEMLGSGVEGFPEWNDWRVRRATSNNYALDYSESELMLARMVSLSTYTLTQQTLADKGLGEDDIVFLMRGSSEESFTAARGLAGPVRLATNPLSSTATRFETADGFGGGQNVAGLRVPRSRIFSYANTGPGTYKEYEVVVMGDPDGLTARVIKPREGDSTTLKASLDTYVDQDELTLANAWVGTSKDEMKLLGAVMAPPKLGPEALVVARIVEALQGDTMYVRSLKPDVVSAIAISSMDLGQYIRSLPPEERFDTLQRVLVANREFDWLEAVPGPDGVPLWNDEPIEPGSSGTMVAKAQATFAETLLANLEFPVERATITPPLNGRVYVYTGQRVNPLTGETDAGMLASIPVEGVTADIERVRGERRLLGARPLPRLYPAQSVVQDGRQVYAQAALEAVTEVSAVGVTVDDVLREAANRNLAGWSPYDENGPPPVAELLRRFTEDTEIPGLVQAALDRMSAWDQRTADLQDEMAELVGVAGGVELAGKQRELTAAQAQISVPSADRFKVSLPNAVVYGEGGEPDVVTKVKEQWLVDEGPKYATSPDPDREEMLALFDTTLASNTRELVTEVASSMTHRVRQATTPEGRRVLREIGFDALVRRQASQLAFWNANPDLRLEDLNPAKYDEMKRAYEQAQAAALRVDDLEAEVGALLSRSAPILQLEAALRRRTALGDGPSPYTAKPAPPGVDGRGMLAVQTAAAKAAKSNPESVEEFLVEVGRALDTLPSGERTFDISGGKQALTFDEVRADLSSFYDDYRMWADDVRMNDIDVAVATAGLNVGSKSERIQAAATALVRVGPIPSIPSDQEFVDALVRFDGTIENPDVMGQEMRDVLVGMTVGQDGELVWEPGTGQEDYLLQATADRMGVEVPKMDDRFMAWLTGEVVFIDNYARDRRRADEAMWQALESDELPLEELKPVPYPVERPRFAASLSMDILFEDDPDQQAQVPAAVAAVTDATNRLLALGSFDANDIHLKELLADAAFTVAMTDDMSDTPVDRYVMVVTAGTLLRTNRRSWEYVELARERRDYEAAWRRWALTNAPDKAEVLRLLGEMDAAQKRALVRELTKVEGETKVGFRFDTDAEREALEKRAEIERLVPGAVRPSIPAPNKPKRFSTARALDENDYFMDMQLDPSAGDLTGSQRKLVEAGQDPDLLFTTMDELVNTLADTGGFDLLPPASDATQDGWQLVGRSDFLPKSADFVTLLKSAVLDNDVPDDAAADFWRGELDNSVWGARDVQDQSRRYWSSWEAWLADIMGPEEAARRMDRIRDLRQQMVRLDGGRYAVDPVVRDDLLGFIGQTEQDALDLQQAGPVEAPASVAT